ncbi:MAG: glycosyltransferase [bacterium]|nr:glycosyltransferase [bacterium]
MSGPLRVLHVITDLRVGGAETMLVKLLGAVDLERYPSAVVSLVPGGELAAPLRDLGVPVTELDLRPGRPDPRALWQLRRVVGEFEPQAIQAWMYHANLAATLAARGRPVVWNIRHSLTDLGDEAPLTRLVIRAGGLLDGRAAAVIHNARVSVAQHARCGYDPAGARVLPNGFDLDRFGPDSSAGAALRAELDLPAGAPLVGLLARRHRFKGHENFLAAMALVRRHRPEVHALCAGRGVADDPDLTALAAGEDLRGHVHLLPARTDAPRFLAGLDLLCVASRWGEGFPNVLGEALACGTPCVTTDVGESREIVAGLGPVVPPDDVPALAEALAEVLQLDAGARADLGRRSRERVAERYALDAVARRYTELWSEVAGSA